MKVDDVGLERLHHAANLEPLAHVVSALAGEFLIAADIDGIPFDPVRQTPGQAIHMVGDSPRPPVTDIENSHVPLDFIQLLLRAEGRTTSPVSILLRERFCLYSLPSKITNSIYHFRSAPYRVYTLPSFEVT